MLKQRVITAIIVGALIVGIVFYAPHNFVALTFGVITLLGAWEWATLIGTSNKVHAALFVTVVAILLILTWMFAQPHHIKLVLFTAGLWWATVVILLALFDSTWLQRKWLRLLLYYSGFIVLVPAWLALLELHKQNSAILMYLLALIWIADIAAYFVGKKYGTKKLAPGISPGKSIQGLWGALAASIVIAIIGLQLFELTKPLWFYFVCLCLATALISVVGDLYESLLKRCAGVKDSGKILPGHGGVLDRIDSLTAAAPGFVVGLYWII